MVTLTGVKHIRFTVLAVRALIERIEQGLEPDWDGNDVLVLQQVLEQLGDDRRALRVDELDDETIRALETAQMEPHLHLNELMDDRPK